MKKIVILLMTVLMTVGLSACEDKVGNITLDKGQSGIYIEKDGTVSYVVSETFEEDYYKKSDLKKMIESEVDSYNSSDKASVKDAIKVKTFKVKNNVANMTLEITTPYDFSTYMLEYNNIATDKFYIGNIENNTECKIKGDFVSPDGKETKKGKEIRQMTEANILIVNEEYKIQIDDTVKYLSDNCTMDDDGVITTSAEGTSYIVYVNE